MCTNTDRSDELIGVNESNGIPIYQQIYDGVINLIIKGILRTGEKLPSVREMALQNNINPNTIQKAYKILESEGYIYSVKGKGNFVGEHDEVLDNYRSQLDALMHENIKALLDIGDTKTMILSYVGDIIEELKNDRD
jgi:GntR family transcriptional regulator